MARGDSRPIKHSSNAILSFSSVCITSLCLVFVIWKSSKCLSKFFDKPQVTEVSVQKAANFPFPAITICSVFGGLGEYQRFNTTYLEDVCGFSNATEPSDKLYQNSGNWITEKCKDPKKVFESIVFKLEDIVASLDYQSYDEEQNNAKAKEDNLQKFVNWQHYDSMKHGRCFTLSLSDEITKFGIKKLDFKLKRYSSAIFIHTPGNFLKASTGKMRYQKLVHRGVIYRLSINHEFNELLYFGGDSCKNEQEYSRDLCTDKSVETEMLNQFGCTSPFGPNKKQICQASIISEEAVSLNVTKIYKNGLFNTETYGECLNPCSFFTFTLTDSFDYVSNEGFGKADTSLELNFENVIKVNKGYHAYSELSLIAEIGGYVGLFLGVSVNQITNLIEYVVLKIQQH